jgi:hypothetical protein
MDQISSVLDSFFCSTMTQILLKDKYDHSIADQTEVDAG